MGQPVVHFEVIGTDGKKLQAYYAELFGWDVDANNRCLRRRVPDVAAALDKAVSLGGTTVFGPETVMGNLVLGQFLDPEGHVIGLIEGAAAG